MMRRDAAGRGFIERCAKDIRPGDRVLHKGKLRIVENVIHTQVSGVGVTSIWCVAMRGQDRWFGKRSINPVRLYIPA